AFLKELWTQLTRRPAVEEPGPSSAITTHYLLPLQWSLHYALSWKEWRTLWERHKKLYPAWERCSCPKGCKANTFDEDWKYDHERHTKIFLGGKFICPGCHWLKSPTWRIRSWLQQENILVLQSAKSTHAIDCLGMTQQQLDDLRKADLRKHELH